MHMSTMKIFYNFYIAINFFFYDFNYKFTRMVLILCLYSSYRFVPIRFLEIVKTERLLSQSSNIY